MIFTQTQMVMNLIKLGLDKKGEIKIDGKNIKDETIYGNGNNIIDIEGGIGSISVELIK